MQSDSVQLHRSLLRYTNEMHRNMGRNASQTAMRYRLNRTLAYDHMVNDQLFYIVKVHDKFKGSHVPTYNFITGWALVSV